MVLETVQLFYEEIGTHVSFLLTNTLVSSRDVMDLSRDEILVADTDLRLFLKKILKEYFPFFSDSVTVRNI